jgi:hypothetical protein
MQNGVTLNKKVLMGKKIFLDIHSFRLRENLILQQLEWLLAKIDGRNRYRDTSIVKEKLRPERLPDP